jgi:hypothetical protein
VIARAFLVDVERAHRPIALLALRSGEASADINERSAQSDDARAPTSAIVPAGPSMR